MAVRLVTGIIATIISAQLAFAQDFPAPDSDLCPNGIVVKRKLAIAFLLADEAWAKLYMRSDDVPEKWRRIFTDDNFCEMNSGCIADNPDKKENGKPIKDKTVAKKT